MAENWDAVLCFLTCGTQWRVGFSGRTGLDYNVLFKIFDLHGIKDHKATLDKIRVMEDAVLSTEGQERQKPKT